MYKDRSLSEEWSKSSIFIKFLKVIKILNGEDYIYLVDIFINKKTICPKFLEFILKFSRLISSRQFMLLFNNL